MRSLSESLTTWPQLVYIGYSEAIQLIQTHFCYLSTCKNIFRYNLWMQNNHVCHHRISLLVPFTTLFGSAVWDRTRTAKDMVNPKGQCGSVSSISVIVLGWRHRHRPPSKPYCLDLDLNDQKKRRYFWQWFHIQKNKSKSKYTREKKRSCRRFWRTVLTGQFANLLISELFHKQKIWFNFVSFLTEQSLFSFSFIFLNMKLLSEVAPLLLVIQIQIQAVWLIFRGGKLKPVSCRQTITSWNFQVVCT